MNQIDEHKVKRISKFLSLVLRHKPEVIGLQLDKNGWADVQELLNKLTLKGRGVDRSTLDFVVSNNSKKRFAFSDDGQKIRASQGHSLSVDLGFEPQTPPEILYHGTASRNVESIRKSGLQKRNRQHVHLSKDRETAITVGQRHGKPVIFEILAEEMMKAGLHFYLSKNGVWLTDEVPVKYLRLE